MTTLAEAQAKVQEHLDAETNCLAAQEARFSTPGGVDRSVVLPELREIRKGLAFWRREVSRLSAEANGQPTFAGMAFTSARFGDFTSGGD